MSLWSIIAVYVAGLIGAGFASGQELVVFFVNYGRAGLAGIFLALCLLTLGSALILDVCTRQNINSYADLFTHLGPAQATLLDWLYTIFLVVGASVMLAGVGALGTTFPYGLFLRLGTACLILLALQKGHRGVGMASGFLAPLLVVILCSVAIGHLLKVGVSLPEKAFWTSLEAGTLYASYNLGFSLAVLASLNKHLKTKKDRLTVVVVANFILGSCMVLLFLALSTLRGEQLQSAFPLKHLLQLGGSVGVIIYQLMLWGAMYSTALANLLALVSRLTSLPLLTWKKASLIGTGAAFALSYLGFGTLVRIAYPILGLAGLWILAGLVRTHFLDRRA